MKYIIDSYAWVEYLEGSKLGEKVREIINDKDKEIFSLNLTIAEIVSKKEKKEIQIQHITLLLPILKLKK